jgi:hypothetical protein
MIKLKDLLFEQLTDNDIKVGDAYHVKSHIGYMVNFVYEKERRGGAIMIEYQFKPQYGDPGFMSVGTGPAESVDGWGKNKKIKVASKMKKMMIKTLKDAIDSKYNGSEETSVLLRNKSEVGSLYAVLSWAKRL